MPTGRRTLVMGIINVTPDSFSGDGLGRDIDGAISHAWSMVEEGADLLDIGGQSTRPGSQPVSEDEEIARVLPVIERLRGRNAIAVPLSVDTSRAAVAAEALSLGVDIINDVSGLRDDPGIADEVARHDAGLILMHMKGNPLTMQQDPTYDDLLGEVIAYLQTGIEMALETGVRREKIWVDPGIGFGKTLQHNLELLRRLGELRVLGCPILVGTSRKGFIGRLLAPLNGGEAPKPGERVLGTAATVALSIANGADAVRVHDVAASVQVARVADAIVRGFV